MTLQLLNGNCLELMASLPDKSIDCFVCDLPYGCLAANPSEVKGHTRYQNGQPMDTTVVVKQFSACAWDVPIDLTEFWKQVKRLARNDHVPVLHFCTTKFGFELYASNPSWFRYDLVWDKGRGVSFLSANKMPMRSHEMVYVFSKKGAAYKRVDLDAPGKGGRQDAVVSTTPRKDNMYSNGLARSNGAPEGKRCATSVIQQSNVSTRGWKHPTAKPIALYHWLLERYCPAGGTVLDPTFGSCNSGRAAQELGLNYIGMEMDAGFYGTARKALLPDDTTIEHV